MPFTPRVYQDKPARTTPVRAEDLAYFQSQYAAVMTDLGNLGMVIGDPGRRMRMIGCSIRNTGSGFQYIEDAQHQRVGFDTISQDDSGVTLGLSFDATRVVGLVVGQDETYAQRAIHPGASVGTDEILIRFGDDSGFYDYVQWDGSNWVSLTGFVTAGAMNATTGLITFTHKEAATDYGGSIEIRSANLRLSAEGRSKTSIGALVYPYNSATSAKAPTTDMKFWITRPGSRPVKPSELTAASGNFWVVGFQEVPE